MRIKLLLSVALCVFGLATDFSMGQGVIPQPNSILRQGDGQRVARTVVQRKTRKRINDQIQGAEAYRLTINSRGALLEAATDQGLFYGQQTLDQLLVGDSVDCMVIDDSPRYAYRALMLDPARHFIPLADIKRYIAIIARYKYNTLHLHLSDDQGFRAQIKAYPRLCEVGAYRSQTEGDGTPHGGFYTQEELAELVSYAARYFVEIIPEIDIPGHSVAAIAAYPFLTCRDTVLDVRTEIGVSKDLLCAGNERVFGMYDTIVDELCRIFPSRFFHLGGDEAPLDHWSQCAKCQRVKEANGIKTNQELMSWFFERLNRTLQRNGKSPLFWYEMDVPYYPAGSTMYAWRHGLSLRAIEAARKGGYKIICSPGEYAYLDYPEARGDIPFPSSSWMGLTPMSKVYQFDPSYGLSADQSSHIQGVEATIWGEYTPTIDYIFERTFPRALAMAEVGWSQMKVRSWDDFLVRALGEVHFLEKMGIKYRKF
ncbi:MAG: beta-N-acetylhexosaminidase [Mucinivorans sp.]